MIRRVRSESEHTGIDLLEMKNLKAIVGGSFNSIIKKTGMVPTAPEEELIIYCRILPPRM